MSGIDEQTQLCGCFDDKDTGYYWRIAGESGTLGYINNKAYMDRWGDRWGSKILSVYRSHLDSGIYSFVSKIRHFKCSKCLKIHKLDSVEFRKLVRLVYATFKRDGWGVERNT